MNPSATARLTVDGMTCGSCERHVREGLEAVTGVRSASVNVVDGVAVVEYDASSATLADLVHAVEGTGYTAQVREEEPTAPSRRRKNCYCCAGQP